MEWYKDLYDEFRMKTNFGSLSIKETQMDVDFICDVMRLEKNEKVLDLFCGIGRHSIELSKRGYIVTGIDLNVNYLEAGKQMLKESANSPNFISGDARTIDYGNDYDAVIIMYNSFGYFSDHEDELILKKVYNSLKPKKRFLIELLNRDWILKNYEKIQEKEYKGIRVVEKREFDFLTSRNNFIIERYEGKGVIKKTGSWRLYSAHEIKNISEGIGFRFINAYSNLQKETLNSDTRLMRLVFEK